jgi:hypothetical protein
MTRPETRDSSFSNCRQTLKVPVSGLPGRGKNRPKTAQPPPNQLSACIKNRAVIANRENAFQPIFTGVFLKTAFGQRLGEKLGI